MTATKPSPAPPLFSGRGEGHPPLRLVQRGRRGGPADGPGVVRVVCGALVANLPEQSLHAAPHAARVVDVDVVVIRVHRLLDERLLDPHWGAGIRVCASLAEGYFAFGNSGKKSENLAFGKSAGFKNLHRLQNFSNSCCRFDVIKIP